MGKIVTVDEQYLINIANAIRNRNGSEEKYTPAEMAGAIRLLTGNGNNELDVNILNGDKVMYEGMLAASVNGAGIPFNEIASSVIGGSEYVRSFDTETGTIIPYSNGSCTVRCQYGNLKKDIDVDLVGYVSSLYVPNRTTTNAVDCKTDLILEGTPEDYEVEMAIMLKGAGTFMMGMRSYDPSPDGLFMGLTLNNSSKTYHMWSAIGNCKAEVPQQTFDQEQLDHLEVNSSGEPDVTITPFIYKFNRYGYQLKHYTTGYVFAECEATDRNPGQELFSPFKLLLQLIGRYDAYNEAYHVVQVPYRLRYIRIRRGGELVYDFRPRMASDIFSNGQIRCDGLYNKLAPEQFYPFTHASDGTLTDGDISGGTPQIKISDFITGNSIVRNMVNLGGDYEGD